MRFGGEGVTDVRQATSFSERTAAAVTMTVPSRSGAAGSDTVRYEWTGLPGAQLTYQFNGGTTATLADDVQDLNLSWITRVMPAEAAGAGSSPKILFVVTSDSSPTGQENLRRALFEAWGYEVQLINQSATQSAFNTAFSETIAAYISEEADANSVGSKLVNATIGVVNEEPELHDEFGFATSVDSTSSLTGIKIKDATHYITQTFINGDLQIYNNTSTVQQLSGTAGGFLELAKGAYSGPGSGDSTLGTLAVGASLAGGGNAAGRRVMLPWGHSSLDINNLHPNGITILRRSLAWAIGDGGDGSSPPANFGYETQFATGVPDVKRIQFATKVTLSTAGNLTSITAYIGGVKGKKYGFAIYSSYLGEPATLLASSNLDTSAGTEWKTLPVTATLAAGDYWLALAFDNSSHQYFREATGGQTRMIPQNVVSDGWLSSWPASSAYDYKISIYGTYSPAE